MVLELSLKSGIFIKILSLKTGCRVVKYEDVTLMLGSQLRVDEVREVFGVLFG